MSEYNQPRQTRSQNNNIVMIILEPSHYNRDIISEYNPDVVFQIIINKQYPLIYCIKAKFQITLQMIFLRMYQVNWIQAQQKDSNNSQMSKNINKQSESKPLNYKRKLNQQQSLKLRQDNNESKVFFQQQIDEVQQQMFRQQQQVFVNQVYQNRKVNESESSDELESSDEWVSGDKQYIKKLQKRIKVEQWKHNKKQKQSKGSNEFDDSSSGEFEHAQSNEEQYDDSQSDEEEFDEEQDVDQSSSDSEYESGDDSD